MLTAHLNLPSCTLQGYMDRACEAMIRRGDAGDTFYSQRVYDLFPQMATATSGFAHSAQASWVFGSGMLSTGDNTHYLEWTVKVPAGNYKIKGLGNHNTNSGRVDLLIDGGAATDTWDQYAASSLPNSSWTSAEFALTEGSHTFRLQKNGKNASSSAWHVGIQHVQLIKQNAGSTLVSPSNAPIIIDVPVVFADSHTNWNTLSITTSYMFGTALQSTGAQNATITYSFWAPKGAFALAMLNRTTPLVGIYTVVVDGTTVGTIDGYSAGTVENVINTSLSGTLTYTGIHTLTLTMATKNASSSGYYGSILHLQIRMTSITEPLSQDLAPEIALLWPMFAASNTNWSTLTIGSTYAHYFRVDSGNTQNDEIVLSNDLLLRPGTYRLDLLGTTASSRGIAHAMVDTVDSGEVDFYTAGTAHNVVKSISGIVLSGYTPHSLAIKMATKNASASLYTGNVTIARLVRTGA